MQVLGGVLAGLVGLSTAMSAHAMDLRDDRCAAGGMDDGLLECCEARADEMPARWSARAVLPGGDQHCGIAAGSRQSAAERALLNTFCGWGTLPLSGTPSSMYMSDGVGFT